MIERFSRSSFSHYPLPESRAYHFGTARRGVPITTDRLIATFEGPHIEKHGVPADCFAEVLQGIQKAIRLMVEHLAGRDPGPGRPPQWVRNQSTIGLVATRPGSMMVELALAPPDGQPELLDYGPQAIDSLLNWNPNGDDSHLPRHVEDGITAMSAALPEDATLCLGTPDDTPPSSAPSNEAIGRP